METIAYKERALTIEGNEEMAIKSLQRITHLLVDTICKTSFYKGAGRYNILVRYPEDLTEKVTEILQQERSEVSKVCSAILTKELG